MNKPFIPNLGKTKLYLREQKSNWKLFFWVLLYSLIPTIWVLIRSLVITRYMDANVETYAQWDYLEIILEIVQQTVVFPLFWWFGKIIIGKKEYLNRVRETYLTIFLLYAAIIVTMCFFVGDLVNAIGSNEGNLQRTFFIFQLLSKIPSILLSVSTVIMLNYKMYIGFFTLLIAKVMFGLTFDLTLANEAVFANPYIGLGLSTFITNLLLFIVSLLMVAKIFGFKRFFDLSTFTWNINKWSFNRQFWSNVTASLIFSVINNVFYLFMIGKNMNIAEGSSAYWLSNTVIWTWILLVPSTIFEINKSLVATTDGLDARKRIFVVAEFQIISLLTLLMSFAIFIPLYRPFAMFLSNNNQQLVDQSWTIFSNLIWFFIFYVLSSAINAHFNGEGRNWILAAHALICNVLTFVPFILMHSIGTIDVYTVQQIALMFGFSLLVSWIISLIFIIFFIRLPRKNNNCNDVNHSQEYSNSPY